MKTTTSKRKHVKLIPPDKKRCQCEEKRGSFMSLGRPYYVRCTEKPTVIVTEVKTGKDNHKGSMSLCIKHLKVLLDQYGIDSFAVMPLKAIKRQREKKS